MNKKDLYEYGVETFSDAKLILQHAQSHRQLVRERSGSQGNRRTEGQHTQHCEDKGNSDTEGQLTSAALWVGVFAVRDNGIHYNYTAQ